MSTQVLSRVRRAAELLWKYRDNPGAVLEYLRTHGLHGAMGRAFDARSQFFGDMLTGLQVPPRPLEPPHRRFDPEAMAIHWLVPRFAPGWGGMMNIFRLAHHLESQGHANVFWIHNPHPVEPSPEPYERMIVEHFQPLRRHRVHYLPTIDDLSQIDGDALIATDYTSAYWARGITRVRERFYLIQDHEPDFHPAGYPALYARQTYRFGFAALCNGAWLHKLARETYGMWSAQWEQAADPLHYHPPPAAAGRQPGHIAFYARHETPRRAVPLGLLAFDILHERGVPFHVDFFGGPPVPVPRAYAHTDHGVLGAAALGALYREASIGMVFSATNYSIIPREMMACGLPVVELDLESGRMSLGEAAVLVEPDPVALADTLQALLGDGERRARVGRAGIDFAARFSWPASGEVVAQALRDRIAAAEAARPMVS